MIDVYGYLGAADPSVRRAVAAAELVVGGARALDAFEVADERRVVLGPVEAAAERLRECNGAAVVLASGDPLYHGIVRRLRAAGLSCRVHPAPSSVAAAFAAVALPWDDAVVVSAHGHLNGLDTALAVCRARPKVAVLTAPGRGLPELAAGLADLPRHYVLAERLGETDERVRVLAGDEALDVAPAEPNVVLVLADSPTGLAALGVSQAIGGGLGAGGEVGAIGPAAALIAGRHLLGLGDLLWYAGPIGADVARACARLGAATFDLTTGPPPTAPAPRLVVVDELDRIDGGLLGTGARLIVVALDAGAPADAARPTEGADPRLASNPNWVRTDDIATTQSVGDPEHGIPTQTHLTTWIYRDRAGETR